MSNGIMQLISMGPTMPQAIWATSSSDEIIKAMEDVWKSFKNYRSPDYIIVPMIRVRKVWRGKKFTYLAPPWLSMRGMLR